MHASARSGELAFLAHRSVCAGPAAWCWRATLARCASICSGGDAHQWHHESQHEWRFRSPLDLREMHPGGDPGASPTSALFTTGTSLPSRSTCSTGPSTSGTSCPPRIQPSRSDSHRSSAQAAAAVAAAQVQGLGLEGQVAALGQS